MADTFNYGRSELRKVPEDADRFGLVLSGTYEDQRKQGGHTRNIGLNKEQYDQVAALVISFNL